MNAVRWPNFVENEENFNIRCRHIFVSPGLSDRLESNVSATAVRLQRLHEAYCLDGVEMNVRCPLAMQSLENYAHE